MYQSLQMSMVLLSFKSIILQEKLTVELMSLMCDVESVYCKRKVIHQKTNTSQGNIPMQSCTGNKKVSISQCKKQRLL